ncbi:uncharacterized protein PITG_03774 [Phytophthora infestans T30-4]|uniref:WRKY19-like zinc finger domain-containing protein n=1 Tax=Phytophthora infestans (strain T30-4) TaxID=403677 RepID=D0MYH3_PHYIT|nr:uncharacterized protein PITG_03774 [Phytophthora infestans T30-4]EEY66221.1 conserved hypothetical protein [Phytophthora infestans T30-4]|eukprot:XP_002906820.1 conserved hypothetical protein [Phytophthora infestans T30-4]
MEAIAHRHACPVCRLQVSPQNVVRLYLSLAEQVARHDNSECNVTHRIEPTNASRLPERLREMKGELDRAHRIQRMTSKHSFRLENAVVRLKQKLEQTTRRMQHIQRELEGAKAQLQIDPVAKQVMNRVELRSYQYSGGWKADNIEGALLRAGGDRVTDLSPKMKSLEAYGALCCINPSTRSLASEYPPLFVSLPTALVPISAPLWMLLFAPPNPSSSCMKKSDNPDVVDMSTAWLEHAADQPRPDAQPVALPALQLAANRHRLAAIMNAEDVATAAAAAAIVGRATAVGARKSSLAFILGGNTDEDRTSSTGPSFGVSTTENRAANVPTPTAAPKASVKKSRICKFENCTRYVVNRGLCIGHGGGKRCAVVGCTSSAKNLGVCWKHGRKCSEENCTKTAVSHGLCWAHGGGKRCVVEGCRKPAYERNGNMRHSDEESARAAKWETPSTKVELNTAYVTYYVMVYLEEVRT